MIMKTITIIIIIIIILVSLLSHALLHSGMYEKRKKAVVNMTTDSTRKPSHLFNAKTGYGVNHFWVVAQLSWPVTL